MTAWLNTKTIYRKKAKDSNIFAITSLSYHRFFLEENKICKRLHENKCKIIKTSPDMNC